MPQINFIDDGAGRPAGIHEHIGRRPIAAFGNSDGDLEMLQWTTMGRGPRLGVLVHHTDAEREYAYDRDAGFGRLDEALDAAAANGWAVVDMKNDWKTDLSVREAVTAGALKTDGAVETLTSRGGSAYGGLYRIDQLLWTLLTATSIGPATAEDAMPMTAMGVGEVIAVMPDGHMARTTVTDAVKMEEMKKIAKPIPWCMMFMMGADGSIYIIDTSAHAPMVECENMVQ